ncbi:unnamed protein product [Paramecium pentaurelia]|uniref:Transmembrane protein n=1 Tax=Paramecium pentaurelia TaxID=43138 RepID=A0A8S1YN45_9CILI|nr:unnamed protein product [Paramecium pentaurelia]
MMIIQVAKILLKLNIWDQHVNVHQDYFLRQQQIHASYVIHHGKTFFKQLLIALQVVKHLQIEYQKDYNVYVQLVIMNINSISISIQIIILLQKIFCQVHVINYVLIMNNYGIIHIQSQMI